MTKEQYQNLRDFNIGPAACVGVSVLFENLHEVEKTLEIIREEYLESQHRLEAFQDKTLQETGATIQFHD